MEKTMVAVGERDLKKNRPSGLLTISEKNPEKGLFPVEAAITSMTPCNKMSKTSHVEA